MTILLVFLIMESLENLLEIFSLMAIENYKELEEKKGQYEKYITSDQRAYSNHDRIASLGRWRLNQITHLLITH